jgi:hypothetical protein
MPDLYKCATCGHTIAATARFCPGCQTPGPIARHPNSWRTSEPPEAIAELLAPERTAKRRWPPWVVYGGLIFFVLAVVGALSNQNSQNARHSPQTTPEAAATSAPVAVATSAPVAVATTAPVAVASPDEAPLTPDEQILGRGVFCIIAVADADREQQMVLDVVAAQQQLQSEWHYSAERAMKIIHSAADDYKAGLWNRANCIDYVLRVKGPDGRSISGGS